MTKNNEQVMFPKEANFLGRRCGRLEPGHPENTVQEVAIL